MTLALIGGIASFMRIGCSHCYRLAAHRDGMPTPQPVSRSVVESPWLPGAQACADAYAHRAFHDVHLHVVGRVVGVLYISPMSWSRCCLDLQMAARNVAKHSRVAFTPAPSLSTLTGTFPAHHQNPSPNKAGTDATAPSFWVGVCWRR